MSIGNFLSVATYFKLLAIFFYKINEIGVSIVTFLRKIYSGVILEVFLLA